MKKLITVTALLTLCALTGADLHLVGDSTMANYRPQSAPQAGWGMFVKPKTGKVFNVAIGGRSSKSYRESGAWKNIMRKVKAGDVVVIQFGHNDANQRRPQNFTTPDKEYKQFLELYIKDVKAAKAHIIIASPTSPLRFNKQKQAYSYLTPYAKAAAQVAAAHKVPFIDMTGFGIKENGKLGPEKAPQYYMHLAPGKYAKWPKGIKDSVHLNQTGAKLYADFFVKELKARKLPGNEMF